MKKGNTNFHLVLARLGAMYDCQMSDCYEHPEYLKAVLQDVYQKDYDFLVEQFKSYLGDLADVKEMDNFFKIMQSP